MDEMRTKEKTGIKINKKIDKTTYEVVIYFNDNSGETMQDKLKRIIMREFWRKADEKKMILITKSLISSNRRYRTV